MAATTWPHFRFLSRYNENVTEQKATEIWTGKMRMGTRLDGQHIDNDSTRTLFILRALKSKEWRYFEATSIFTG